MSSAGQRLRCPNCGAVYFYSQEKIDESNSIECQNCMTRFIAQEGPQQLTGIPIDETDTLKPSIDFLSETVDGIKIKCPHCGSSYIYKDEHGIATGSVNCQNCGKAIEAVGEDVVVVKEREVSGSSEDCVLCALIVIIFLFVPWIIALPLIVCIGLLKAQQHGVVGGQESKVIKKDDQGPGPK